MKRPILISLWAMFYGLIAVIGLIGFVLEIVFKFSGRHNFVLSHIGFYTTYSSLTFFVPGIISLGLFQMMSWAPILFIVYHFLGLAILYWERPVWIPITSFAIVAQILFPLMFLGSVLPYWKRMAWQTPALSTSKGRI